MAERGVIRNRAYAQQIKDFSGMRFGSITPTDIDAFIEFRNRLFIFIEGKHCGAPLPGGQKLALERLVDACHCPPKRISTAIIVDHYDSASEDVDYATAPVRCIRWNGQWMEPHQKGILLKGAVEALIQLDAKLNKPHLQLVK
jgi:hypothetical protein